MAEPETQENRVENEGFEDLVDKPRSLELVEEPQNEPEKESPSDEHKQSPNKTLCGICEINESKYKCPRCYLPYCSVACNKIHRETHASEPEPAPKPRSLVVPPPSATEQGHGIDNNPFHVLESSEQLQYLFKKYPRLRDQLLDIHTATMEPPSIKSKIPASLMKDLPKNSDTWDRDKGIANGKAALRKARRAAGEDGEALREYSELVKHFLDNPESVAKG